MALSLYKDYIKKILFIAIMLRLLSCHVYLGKPRMHGHGGKTRARVGIAKVSNQPVRPPDRYCRRVARFVKLTSGQGLASSKSKSLLG